MKGQHREYEARIEELTKKKAVLEEENANLVKASAQIYESTEELNIKIQQLEEENARLKKGNVEREGDFHKKEQEEKRYLLEKDEDSPDSWFLRTIRSQKNGE